MKTQPARSRTLRTLRTRLFLEALEDRSTPTVFGNPWPDAAHLTFSFTPDGTTVGTATSNLAATLNAVLPTSVWQTAALRAWQTWAVNANVNIGVVNDTSGLALGTAGLAEGDSRFGDIRLAGYGMAPQAVAVASPFDAALGTWSGDVKVNTTMPFGSTKGSYDLFTVLLHEAGHTFGLDDSNDPTSAMYEDYIGARTGPSAGDIALLQSFYGARTPDSYEGASGNGDFSTASPLSLVSSNNVLAARADADLTTTSDKDFYRFTVPLGVTGLTVRVQTLGLSLATPRLTVYNAAKQAVATVAVTNPNQGNLEIHLNNLSLLSTYYVKVEGARSDVFGVGGYVLKVDSLPGVTGVVSTTGGLVQDTTNTLLNVDLHTNDSFLTSSLLAPLAQTTDSRFDIAYKGSISDSSDVDFYKIKAPKVATGAPNVMTVMAWGLKVGGLDPKVTVYDAYQKVVPAMILVNDSNSFTLQVPNAVSGATYYVKIQAAQPQTAQGTGNYFLGIDFGTQADVTTAFAADALTANAPQISYTMTTYQTQLHHYVLSTDTGASTVQCAVRVTIYDRSGNVLISRVANGGDSVSFDIVLAPGTYTVRIAAGTKDPTQTLPNINFSLSGIVGSDPIGPTPTDPTMDPSGSSSPSGSTSPAPTSDPSTSSTSSGSTSGSYDSTPTSDAQPTYQQSNKAYPITDPYGNPYSPY